MDIEYTELPQIEGISTPEYQATYYCYGRRISGIGYTKNAAALRVWKQLMDINRARHHLFEAWRGGEPSFTAQDFLFDVGVDVWVYPDEYWYNPYKHQVRKFEPLETDEALGWREEDERDEYYNAVYGGRW